MRAVILAGGKGTRLQPYSSVFPKPLMPIGEIPILEIVLRQLKHAGVTTATLTVGHLAALIESYFGQGEKLGVDIEYSREEQPLGTAGPLGLLDGIQEDFLVMNGDLLTTVDYADLMQQHLARRAAVTVAVYDKRVDLSLGVLEIEDDKIVAYREKPSFTYPVSMGIYAFSPAVQSYIPRNQPLDLPDLIMMLVNAGENVVIYRFDGIWLDIGRREDYENAVETFEQHKAEFLREA